MTGPHVQREKAVAGSENGYSVVSSGDGAWLVLPRSTCRATPGACPLLSLFGRARL